METTTVSTPAIGRVIVLLYGIISYFVGVAGLLCIIGACAHIIAFGFMGTEAGIAPLLVNGLLVGLCGGIHSIMARQGFKQWLTRFVTEPAERPT